MNKRQPADQIMPHEICTLELDIVQSPPESGIGTPPVAPPAEHSDRSRRRSWPIERVLLRRLWQEIGRPPVEIVLWDGEAIGPREHLGRIFIRQPRALWQFSIQPSLAFGEGYSRGDLDIEGDLVTVLETLNRSLAHGQSHSIWSRVWRMLKTLRRSHSLRASKAAVKI